MVIFGVFVSIWAIFCGYGEVKKLYFDLFIYAKNFYLLNFIQTS